MGRKKIEDFLNSVDLPDKINDEHKRKLRRELLNSSHFNRSYFFGIPVIRFAASAAAVLLLAAVVTFVFLNDTISSGELLNKLNMTYAGFEVPGKMSYLQSDLKIFGKEDETLNLKVDKWIDHSKKYYRVIVAEIRGGNIVDERIYRGDELFGMNNPSLRAFNTRNARRFVLYDAQSEISDSPKDIQVFKEKTIDGLDSIKINLTEKKLDYGVIVFSRPPLQYAEVNPRQNKPFRFKVHKEVDLNEYYTLNPVDIIDKMESAERVEVEGVETDSETGKEFVIIKSFIPVSEREVKNVMVFMTKEIDSLEGELMWNSKSDSQSLMNFEVKLIDSAKLTRIGDGGESYTKIKTIRVDAETGDIRKVTIALDGKEEQTLLSETVFTKHILTKSDSSLFDPVGNSFIKLTENTHEKIEIREFDLKKKSEFKIK